MPVVQVDLGAVESSQADRVSHLRELHGAAERVVIGQRKRFVAQFTRALS
jgi:hypothetical protein